MSQYPVEKEWGDSIVAYYAGWETRSGREVAHIDASRLTHLNYAFANIGPDLRAVVGDPEIDIEKRFPDDTDHEPFYGNFNQLRKLKERYPHLKVMIAIGGWTWSGRFSDAALRRSGDAPLPRAQWIWSSSTDLTGSTSTGSTPSQGDYRRIDATLTTNETLRS